MGIKGAGAGEGGDGEGGEACPDSD
jgi:hypothetical protein